MFLSLLYQGAQNWTHSRCGAIKAQKTPLFPVSFCGVEVFQVPYKDQGLWTGGFFQLSEEVLTYFFLIKRSGSRHAANVTHVHLLINALQQALKLDLCPSLSKVPYTLTTFSQKRQLPLVLLVHSFQRICIYPCQHSSHVSCPSMSPSSQ